MHFSAVFALTLYAPFAAGAAVGSPRTGAASELLGRQLSQTCINNYGNYPVYTGGNSGDEDCGVEHLNCDALHQYCVPYPSFACPPRGYTCSSL